ncbi:unnamed protein product [Moneuplotes crassus]|uniref:Uncharacterized protein n=1 Tax=Euplotes crassus TaxID=5936 RepID=A0AAD1X7P7_EUPCR|nr:unnamed protein product [Moneuplotes crassus]
MKKILSEESSLNKSRTKMSKMRSGVNIKTIFENKFVEAEEKDSCSFFKKKRPETQPSGGLKVKKSSILKRLMSPRIGRDKRKYCIQKSPKSSLLGSRGGRRYKSPSAPTVRPRTSSTNFRKPRFSFCNRNHLQKLQNIMNESENCGMSGSKMVSGAKLYMRKMNLAFDQVLENINTSRMLRNSNGQLCKALEDAYLEKLEEAEDESREARKIISEYHKEVLNPNPKMVRMEIQCNKLKRKKMLSCNS